MQNLDKSSWQALPDIYVRLQKDELGYPPREWEQLKGDPTGTEGVYRIKSIPFYARGLALDDVVVTGTSPEGYEPVVEAVKSRSGFSTMRLMISENESRQELINSFTKMGAMLEFNGRLVAVAIPREMFDQVSNYICDEKDRGRWDAEDGYLVLDEERPPHPSA